MRATILSKITPEDLEISLNDFLHDHPNDEIVEIKYTIAMNYIPVNINLSAGGASGDRTVAVFSAMILWEENEVYRKPKIKLPPLVDPEEDGDPNYPDIPF